MTFCPHLGGPWATPSNSPLCNRDCGGRALPQATRKGLNGNYVCLMQCQKPLFTGDENSVPPPLPPALFSVHFTHKQAQTHADGLPTADSLSSSLIFKKNTFVQRSISILKCIKRLFLQLKGTTQYSDEWTRTEWITWICF